jgi:hypothetical protein
VTTKRYREEHPEEEAARRRRYVGVNREKVNEQQRQWRAANLEEQRKRDRDRRRGIPGRNKPEAAWQQKLWRDHGMRPEGWAELWADQGGCCYLCEESLPETGRGVAIEHDHRCCPQGKSCSRCRRGLAHTTCNSVVGMAGDDPGRLSRIAASYARAEQKVLKRLRPPLALFEAEDLEVPS